MQLKQTYIALLRGINVGGHHKVPMTDVRREMELMGFGNIIILLNSGNIIFDAVPQQEDKFEEQIASSFAKTFGFPVPVLLRTSKEILEIEKSQPFKDIVETKDTRLYISFLKQIPEQKITLPWISNDGSFQINSILGRTICSILDLSVTSTPQGMDALEKLFGKNITTRNWNTVSKIADKLK